MKEHKLIAVEFKGSTVRCLLGLFGIFVMTMIYSCGDSGSKLIGAWSEYSQYEYGKERAEFFKDGSCYFEAGNQRVAGRWSSLEDGRIKVEVNKSGLFGETSVMTLFVVVTGDELVLDGGGDNRGTYVRNDSQRATQIQSEIKRVVEEREIRIEAEKRAQAEKLKAERMAREEQMEAERAARAKRQEAERAAHAKQQEAERARRAGLEALQRGLYSLGIAELEKSGDLGNVVALNDLAWHLATCKDATQHDGKRAVELALKVTNLEPQANYLDTLAAAYARNGQFEEAVRAQVQALSLGNIRGGEERLNLYRQNRPYQDN